jgi:hypothetical protein
MKKICEYCGQLFPLNPKVPGQGFCNREKCQKKRRSLWQKEKRSTDKAYRENQNDAQEARAKRNEDYWMKYRKDHTAYTEKNRKLQKNRNQKRKELRSLPDFVKSEIAKMDASKSKSNLISGYYRLTPITDDRIAKMDVLIIKIDVITSGYSK